MPTTGISRARCGQTPCVRSPPSRATHGACSCAAPCLNISPRSMLTLPLDPTDDRANPAFKNKGTLVQWLAQLQFTNLHAAHQQVRKQLDEFNRLPMRALDRLDTLELLRETVAEVQADYAKKLVAKKLPLSPE